MMATTSFRCILSEATSDTNVSHNHSLFETYPHPRVFGFTGFVPLSSVPPEGGADLKVFPDLANAEGTGPHGDFTWKLHGIPSYAYCGLGLCKSDLNRNNYRIIPRNDSEQVEEVMQEGRYPENGCAASLAQSSFECRCDELRRICTGSDCIECRYPPWCMMWEMCDLHKAQHEARGVKKALTNHQHDKAAKEKLGESHSA